MRPWQHHRREHRDELGGPDPAAGKAARVGVGLHFAARPARLHGQDDGPRNDRGPVAPASVTVVTYPAPSENSADRPDRRNRPGAENSRDRPENPGDPGRDLVEVPAVEVISRAAVMLLSAAAEHLGLSATDPDDPPHRDLDEARRLITALAGLVKASAPDLGPHAAAFRDGLAALQRAFREYSLVEDEPGRGPGGS